MHALFRFLFVLLVNTLPHQNEQVGGYRNRNRPNNVLRQNRWTIHRTDFAVSSV